jgi:hypothetical protein
MPKYLSQGLTPYAISRLPYPRTPDLWHANPHPSLEVAVTFRRRCCKCPPPPPPRPSSLQPSPNSPSPSSRPTDSASLLHSFSLSTDPHSTSLPLSNTLVTKKHFNVCAHPYGHHHVLVPDFYGHKCNECDHRACDTCSFLEVEGEHVVEMLDRGAGLRIVREGVDVWEKIGLRQEREREREVGC